MNKRHISGGLQSGVSHSYTRRGWNRWGKSQSHIGFTQDFPCIPHRKRYVHFHLSALVFFGTFLPSDFFLLPSSWLAYHLFRKAFCDPMIPVPPLLSVICYISSLLTFFLITRCVMLVSNVNLIRSRLTQETSLWTLGTVLVRVIQVRGPFHLRVILSYIKQTKRFGHHTHHFLPPECSWYDHLP